MSNELKGIKLTKDPLENIKKLAPLLDETSQNQVFGLIFGMVKAMDMKECRVEKVR